MPASYITNDDTICALSTPPGSSAIAVIRLSGKKSLSIIKKIFKTKSRKAVDKFIKSHQIYLGNLYDKDKMIDEVLIGYYKKPNSYTGEDVVEISCHGSEYIQQRILNLLIQSGARIAKPGEYTLRAFLNGKMDLSQAEAVADLISSNSESAHQLALKQMRGGYSEKIKSLREQLVNFTSLIELELDFSEEDVEFADRQKLGELLSNIEKEIKSLLESFAQGNVLKRGIPVAIIGKPNVGKSTLLNAILNEERAIVSEIPGTTRDAIEDTIIIKGVSFRFIDTAGLRESSDEIEILGVEKTFDRLLKADIILYVFDINKDNYKDVINEIALLRDKISEYPDYTDLKEKRIIPIANKIDQLIESPEHLKKLLETDCIFISAKRKENIPAISESLLKTVNKEESTNVIVSNARHFEALSRALEAIGNIQKGFENNLSSDLITIDIRQALHYLGEITGEVTTNEILDTIFSNFCVGK